MRWRSPSYSRSRLSSRTAGCGLCPVSGLEPHRLAQFVPRGFERERVQRAVDREPLLVAALGGHALGAREHEKVLNGNRLPPRVELERRANRSGEVPRHTRLLPRLAQCRLGRRLSGLDVALREHEDRRVFLRSDEEDAEAIVFTAEDDRARLRDARGHAIAAAAAAAAAAASSSSPPASPCARPAAVCTPR